MSGASVVLSASHNKLIVTVVSAIILIGCGPNRVDRSVESFQSIQDEIKVGQSREEVLPLNTLTQPDLNKDEYKTPRLGEPDELDS